MEQTANILYAPVQGILVYCILTKRVVILLISLQLIQIAGTCTQNF